MPSQKKLWWGRSLYWFQESFWVRNRRTPSELHDLGQGRRVAEHVGQPDVVGLQAELLEVEALPVDDLAHQRLARGDVAVGLHPHAAGRFDATLGDAHLHALPQVRVVVAHPGQVLGLGDDEAVLGVAVHEGEHRGEGAGALAHRLAERPEPGRVEVGVADRGDPMGRGRGRLAEQLVHAPWPPRASWRRCRGGRGGWQARSSPAQEPGPARLVLGQPGQELDGHPEIVEELVEGRVGRGQVGPGQGEQRRPVRLGHEQGPRVGAERASAGWPPPPRRARRARRPRPAG